MAPNAQFYLNNFIAQWKSKHIIQPIDCIQFIVYVQFWNLYARANIKKVDQRKSFGFRKVAARQKYFRNKNYLRFHWYIFKRSKLKYCRILIEFEIFRFFSHSKPAQTYVHNKKKRELKSAANLFSSKNLCKCSKC